MHSIDVTPDQYLASVKAALVTNPLVTAFEIVEERWDNVEHHRELPGFPHHIHLDDGGVEPGTCLGILALLDSLSTEIAGL